MPKSMLFSRKRSELAVEEAPGQSGHAGCLGPAATHLKQPPLELPAAQGPSLYGARARSSHELHRVASRQQQVDNQLNYDDDDDQDMDDEFDDYYDEPDHEVNDDNEDNDDDDEPMEAYERRYMSDAGQSGAHHSQLNQQQQRPLSPQQQSQLHLPSDAETQHMDEQQRDALANMVVCYLVNLFNQTQQVQHPAVAELAGLSAAGQPSVLSAPPASALATPTTASSQPRASNSSTSKSSGGIRARLAPGSAGTKQSRQARDKGVTRIGSVLQQQQQQQQQQQSQQHHQSSSRPLASSSSTSSVTHLLYQQQQQQQQQSSNLQHPAGGAQANTNNKANRGAHLECKLEHSSATRGGGSSIASGVSEDLIDSLLSNDASDSKRSCASGSGSGESFVHYCNDCGKRYSTSSNLARHRQTHRDVTDKKAKKCPECDKIYVSMPAFAMHFRTHNKGCICSFCGKSFSRPWLLQGHIRTHTGEKPFPCKICNKAFADKSNLRAHIQTHSTTKPFVCSRCNKAFALKSYLCKHVESTCMRANGSQKEPLNLKVSSASAGPNSRRLRGSAKL